ncbi:mechanosensitive ion channel family protein [Aliikangiella sp. IMCC44359]|uniref:mechanosensitive ion channel family protein n=1 Tax=Aliikangiella sp. IMCC44359 TaxID=3459125 RepID=UPI00403AEFC3
MAWINYFIAALLILCGAAIAKVLSHKGISYLESKFTIKNSLIMRRLIFYTIITLFIIMALSQLGVKLGVLLGAAGIFSVAVGFASQTSMSNVISGLFMLGEGTIAVGDMIKVGNTMGEVISIDWLSIKLRTPDNTYVRLPNETIIKSEMTNLSKFAIRRYDLNFSIAYKEDIVVVKNLVLDLVRNELNCLVDPEPMVVLEGFGDSGINLRLAVWAKSDEFVKFRSGLTEKVKAILDANGIEIPFPHVSLYAGENSSPIKVMVSQEDKNCS